MLNSVSIGLTPVTNHDERLIGRFRTAVKDAKVETVSGLRTRIEQEKPTTFQDTTVNWPDGAPNPEPRDKYTSTSDAVSQQIAKRINLGIARQASYNREYPVGRFRGGTKVSNELSPSKPETLPQFDQVVNLLSNPDSARERTVTIKFDAVYDADSNTVVLEANESEGVSARTSIEFSPDETAPVTFIDQHEGAELCIKYKNGAFTIDADVTDETESVGSSTRNFTVPLRNLSVVLDDLSDADLARLLYNSVIRKRAFDIFTVVSGARELAVLHDDSSGTYGDLFFDEFDDRFGTRIEKRGDLWYFFSPDATNPEETIDRVDSGVEPKEMGRLLDYPEPDLRDEKSAFSPSSFAYLLYLYGEIAQEEYEYVGLCPYVPQASRDGIQRAAEYGERMAESLRQFDAEYGTTLGAELVNTMQLSAQHMDGLGIHDTE